jgi:hypothetical protein
LWSFADLEEFARMILPQQYQHHPELRLLAQQLGQSRFASRAPSTIKSHQHRWQLFADWLAKIDSTAQPIGVQPALVALYLQKLTTESKADAIGPSRVLGASAAIACYHWFFGQPSPTQHPVYATSSEKPAVDNSEHSHCKETPSQQQTYGY